MRNDWLTEDGRPHANIFLFDFWGSMAEERANPPQGVVNTLRYEYEREHDSGDSHPNVFANETVGPIFAQRIVDVIEEFFTGLDRTPPAAPSLVRLRAN